MYEQGWVTLTTLVPLEYLLNLGIGAIFWGVLFHGVRTTY